MSGCGKRPTPEEYRDELKERVRDYISAVTDIALDIQKFDESGSPASDFEDHCKACEKAIKNIEKIRYPVDMVYKHEQFLEAFDIEREWLAAVRELMSTKTPGEKEQVLKKIETIVDSEDTFMYRYMEILMDLPREDGSFKDFLNDLGT